ncbi:tyrosine protein kinase [Enterococcus florum]|uniref:Capsular polysaccharide biosynthesis protein CpsC n=1 Tax=Enterococcus florum TaxID=2480627 RepID=A0A4P5P6C2_9ENTE|nr:Wzz/FepE/Etk N-terminal domain-containing protein [Enterococcus florum]GCF93290.1 tyrosine protein kinase [Enterococcus florum]
MEETVSVQQLLEVLRKRLRFIIIGGVLGILIAGVLAFFVLTPKYSSQAQLVVTLPQTETTNANDVNTNLQMINTYKDIITGDLVTKEVAERLETDSGLALKPEELKEMIHVEQNQNSQMFSIIATSTKPREAATIANVTAETFQANAKNVLNVDRISIISNAVADNDPIFPNKKLMLLIGLVGGVMAGVVLAIVRELLDRTIKDSKTLTEDYGFTVLGNIPAMTNKELNAKLRRPAEAVSQPRPEKKDRSTGEARRRRTRV